jgi:hypothetical protein
MTELSLEADCERCAALCCVGPAFDRSEDFGFDKPAGEPCRHLDPGGRCRIHDDLKGRGFAGCAAYHCRGAGPYVVQAMFAGRSWMDDPDLLAPMIAAFAEMRQVHELLHALRGAAGLEPPPAAREALAEIELSLRPSGGWSSEDVSSGAVAAAVRAARDRLRALRPLFQSGGP